MTDAMIRIGTLLFKWRNLAFPLILLALYALVPPPPDFLGHAAWLAPKNALALAITAAGLGLRLCVIGFRYIKRGGVDKKVYADTLVTGGLFGIGRNPLYVGNMLTYAGVFLLHGDLRIAIGGTLLFLFIYQCIILTEEQYLARKFGAAYAAYCARVPRWRLRWSRFGEATAGMRFDLRKAVVTDYNTITSTVVILTGTTAWRALAGPQPVAMASVWPLAAVAAATGLCALAIHGYKRSPAGKAARG